MPSACPAVRQPCAGDILHPAPYVDGVDGLGNLGGSHVPEEYAELRALEARTAQAADGASCDSYSQARHGRGDFTRPRHEPSPIPGDPMTRRDDQRIAALAKKNAAKVKPPRQEQAADFDPTLRQRAPEQDSETKRLFKEMKRREF